MRIELNGRVVGYEDTGGKQTPLILIHGFPLDRTVWSAQVRGLATDARVVAIDLRGFGESAPSNDPAATTMDAYARDVATLIDHIGIPSAVIGGVSMGGYVAMAFRRLFPSRLRGLILVDTRAGPDSADARKGREDAAALARSKGSAAVAATMLPKMLTPAADQRLRGSLDAMMSAQSVDGVVGALAAIRDRPDSMPSMATVSVPTLVVCGVEDQLIPPTESDALHDAIPGSRLVRIPGAAHLPNYEQPELFNAAMREFLLAM